MKSRTSIDNLDTMLKENNLRIDFKQRIATVRESGRSEEEKKSKIRELREAYNKKKAELTIKFGRDLWNEMIDVYLCLFIIYATIY